MRLKRAFRLLTDNFSNVYKMLLYRGIMICLAAGLTYFVLSLGLNAVMESAEANTLKSMVSEFFTALVSGNTEYLVSFSEAFPLAVTDFLNLVMANMGSIVGSVIGVVVLYLVFRVLNGIATFAVCSILNDRMSYYAKTSFAGAYFPNLGRAVLYQIIYVPIAFVYDLVSLALCWGFCWVFFSAFSSWGFFGVLIGLALSIAGYVCLQALKMAWFSPWMPSVILEKKVGTTLGKSLSCAKKFSTRFGNFLIAIYLIFAVNVTCAFATLGSMLLITVPASFVLLSCLQLVCYYEDNGKKYYLAANRIVGGEDELPTAAQ